MKEESHEYLYHLINDCEFEDGVSNAAIEYLIGLNEDDSEACTDLIHNTYVYYAYNFKFLGKLCRCLCWLDIDDSDPISDEAYSILKTCIGSDNSYCQEGAIMLCEELRNTYCFELLALYFIPCNDVVKQYADSVMLELDSELFNN